MHEVQLTPAFRCFFQNQRGSTLVWALALAVFLGVLAYPLYSLLGNAAKLQQQRSARAEFAGFINDLREQMRNPVLCHKFLGGQKIKPTIFNPTGLKNDSIYPDPMNSAQNSFFVDMGLNMGTSQYPVSFTKNSTGPVWTSADGRFTIQQFKAVTMWYGDDAGDAFPTFIPRQSRLAYNNSPIQSTYLIRLFIMPGNPIIGAYSQTISGTHVENTDYEIDLYADVDASNNIVTCYGTDSEAAACEQMGGAFDAKGLNPVITGAAYRCNPYSRCFPSQQGIVSSPTECASPFKTASWIGDQQYLCMWCNPNTL